MESRAEQRSFARHFLQELRDNGVSQKRIDVFVDEVDKIMQGNQEVKSKINSAKRRALNGKTPPTE